MSEPFEPARANEQNDQPADPARRTLLRHGVKLAYVVPVVLAALKATPASAQVPSGQIRCTLLRAIHDVPADVLAWIREIESGAAFAG